MQDTTGHVLHEQHESDLESWLVLWESGRSLMRSRLPFRVVAIWCDDPRCAHHYIPMVAATGECRSYTCVCRAALCNKAWKGRSEYPDETVGDPLSDQFRTECTKQSQSLAKLQSRGATAGISCSESKISCHSIASVSEWQHTIATYLCEISPKNRAIVWGRGGNRKRNRRQSLDGGSSALVIGFSSGPNLGPPKHYF